MRAFFARLTDAQTISMDMWLLVIYYYSYYYQVGLKNSQSEKAL